MLSLNILIREIFDEDIRLSGKNNNIWSHSYDVHGWSSSPWYGDTKDTEWVPFRERVYWIDMYKSMNAIIDNMLIRHDNTWLLMHIKA